jgi:uncharacterized protein YaiL (DUF2058 family)
MGKSLQDQLLKAGLANKKQAVRAKKAKNSKEKLKRTGKEVEDESAQLAKQAMEEKLAKDKALNEEKNRQAELAAIKAQIHQIVAMNRVEERGDIEHRFPDGSTITTMLLTDTQRKAVINGVLAIVKTNDQYDLIPRKAAQKIAERDESLVLVCNDNADEQAEDDEYADFQVPDDLMW